MGMASASVGGGQKRCKLQWKFVVAGLGCHNGLLRFVDFTEVGLGSQPKPLCSGINSSINSDEPVSSTNKLKAFILIAFYVPLMSLKTTAIEAVKLISEALVHVLNSGEAFEAFQKFLFFLIALLFTIIRFHFEFSDISPLETHYAIFLLFLVAIFVYGLAYVLIAVQPQDSDYLSKLRFICLVFGTLAIELPALIIISPFWLFMVNLCSILIIGVLCSYKQISQYVCQIYGWLVQGFPSAAGDNNNKVAEIV